MERFRSDNANNFISQRKRYMAPSEEIHGPEVIKHFSYLTQLCMKFVLVLNVKMSTILSRSRRDTQPRGDIFMLMSTVHEIYSAHKRKCWHFPIF